MVDPAVNVELYTSSFCEPCIATRSVLAEAQRLVPAATVVERNVATATAEAAQAGIRSTPTVIIRGADDAELFRAEGVPTLNQVLVALAKAV